MAAPCPIAGPYPRNPQTLHNYLRGATGNESAEAFRGGFPRWNRGWNPRWISPWILPWICFVRFARGVGPKKFTAESATDSTPQIRREIRGAIRGPNPPRHRGEFHAGHTRHRNHNPADIGQGPTIRATMRTVHRCVYAHTLAAGPTKMLTDKPHRKTFF